jgi:formate dehydrogenase subunit gamma
MNRGDRLQEIVDLQVGREGPLLPILHGVQDAFGCISEAHIVAIAAALNLSRAEVSGVVSFYHDFRRTPRARPTIKLCRAEACQSRGVEALAASLGSDARVELEAVYCLGLCSVGPAALVGSEVHARLNEASLGALIERVATA